MTHQPLIVLTNDDGIRSPGLRAAAEAVLTLGELLIMAPTEQQTAMGRSFWGAKHERFYPADYPVNGTSVRAYHCHSSPAQVIVHGLDVLVPEGRPDLLISGVNYGENLGLNVTLSGTVGAAMQAASMGVPALAVSLQTDVAYHYAYGELEWAAARHFVQLFARKMLAGALPEDVDVLKVDIPSDATPETPWRVTRLARQSYFYLLRQPLAPETKIGDRKVIIDVDHDRLEADSDIHAVVNDRVVSVTPLSLDLTSRVGLDAVRDVLG
ncbi:MAG: 5'/3'-nucleotidase SurE [Lentisphaerae bacterium]|nr:5'/3'-nucleotidase SurE [Lentisphaerota bacterium]